MVDADGAVVGLERCRTRRPRRASRSAACASPPRPTSSAAADVAQLEAATADGSVFVVRDGEPDDRRDDAPEPTVGLVFYDLKTCLRSIDERRLREKKATMPRRKVVTGVLLAAGSLAGSVLVRRRAARKRERVDLYADDGSMLSLADGSPEALEAAAARPRAPGRPQ